MCALFYFSFLSDHHKKEYEIRVATIGLCQNPNKGMYTKRMGQISSLIQVN